MTNEHVKKKLLSSLKSLRAQFSVYSSALIINNPFNIQLNKFNFIIMFLFQRD